MAQRNLRLPDPLAARIAELSKKQRYATPSAFIRSAIEEKLDGRNGQEAEDRIAATLERLGQELRRLETALQAQFALLDAVLCRNSI
jgi:Arc/MetJ-type ribon-helix-helix transcriptional regulator